MRVPGHDHRVVAPDSCGEYFLIRDGPVLHALRHKQGTGWVGSQAAKEPIGLDRFDIDSPWRWKGFHLEPLTAPQCCLSPSVVWRFFLRTGFFYLLDGEEYKSGRKVTVGHKPVQACKTQRRNTGEGPTVWSDCIRFAVRSERHTTLHLPRPEQHPFRVQLVCCEVTRAAKRVTPHISCRPPEYH